MLRIPTREAVFELGLFLHQSNYDGQHLRHLGLVEGVYGDMSNLNPLLEKTAGDDILHVLARLFFIAWHVDAKVCEAVFPKQVLQTAIDSGMLYRENDQIHSRVVVVPYKGLHAVCDAVRLRADAPDKVTGPSRSTYMVSYASIRGQDEVTLDLGTGTGALAMEATTYSKSVIGTDVNARAIDFARFNAALNGVQNVSFCAGDAFQPVMGQKFTRIIANPPFFLSRASKYTFSDSPLELDGFTEQLARQAPSFLQDGGFFQMICEWVQVGDQPWPERLKAWTERSGCDVFVLRRSESLFTPVQYSEHRMQEAQLLHNNPSPDMFEDQLSHLKEKGVTLVCGGIFSMRKRSGSNWFETAIGNPAGDELGESILRRFNQLTITHTRPEAELLKERYRFAGDAAIQQRHALKDGRWEVLGGEIISTGGFEGKFAVDSVVSQFLPLFDGNATIGEIATHVAEDLKLKSQEAEKRCIDLTRRLLRNGFVERV